jgi:hypothetical protein
MLPTVSLLEGGTLCVCESLCIYAVGEEDYYTRLEHGEGESEEGGGGGVGWRAGLTAASTAFRHSWFSLNLSDTVKPTKSCCRKFLVPQP